MFPDRKSAWPASPGSVSGSRRRHSRSACIPSSTPRLAVVKPGSVGLCQASLAFLISIFLRLWDSLFYTSFSVLPHYVYGAVEPATGENCFLILPYCNTVCTNIFLQKLSDQYKDDMVLLCCDGAAWHKAKALVIPDNIELFFLPPYTPEMNPIEQIW